MQIFSFSSLVLFSNMTRAIHKISDHYLNEELGLQIKFF